MFKDRGLQKWNGFMLPEHMKALNTHYEHYLDIEKPQLGEEQLEDMNRTLQEALFLKAQVTVQWFQNGRKHGVVGRIVKVDGIDKRLVIEANDRGQTVYFQDVIHISLMDEAT